MHMSPTLAAGMPEMMTVGQHGGMMGPPTWGTRTVTIGQVCMSVMRAAGGMTVLPRRVLGHGASTVVNSAAAANLEYTWHGAVSS